MTTATFLASLGAGSRARARAPWAGLVGLALALTATTAQALAPPVPVCYPHQDGMASYDPADLGDGIVARTEIFYGEDGSYDRRWDVVTHCASGISIAAQVSSNEDVEVVRALVRSAIASPQVFTLEDRPSASTRPGARPSSTEVAMRMSRPAPASTSTPSCAATRHLSRAERT